MPVYTDRLTRGYLDKSSTYSIPKTKSLPSNVKILQPTLSEIQLSEFSSDFSFNLVGKNLWFCFNIELLSYCLSMCIQPNSVSDCNAKATCETSSDVDGTVFSDVQEGATLHVNLCSSFLGSQNLRTIFHKKVRVTVLSII